MAILIKTMFDNRLTTSACCFWLLYFACCQILEDNLQEVDFLVQQYQFNIFYIHTLLSLSYTSKINPFTEKCSSSLHLSKSILSIWLTRKTEWIILNRENCYLEGSRWYAVQTMKYIWNNFEAKVCAWNNI